MGWGSRCLSCRGSATRSACPDLARTGEIVAIKGTHALTTDLRTVAGSVVEFVLALATEAG